MSGIEAIRRAFLRAEGTPAKAALIGYLTAGYPDPREFLDLVETAFDAGLDLLELGVPFSDPVADGKTIQASSEAALRAGITLTKTLEIAGRIIERVPEKPVVLMSYLNPILRMGIDRFFGALKSKGVAGVIIPDLIPDEAEAVRDAASRHERALVFLVAPNSTTERRKKILRASTGFLYAIGLEGVTGERDDLSADSAEFLQTLRKERGEVGRGDLPIAYGFGVSRPEHFRELARHADGVIVGSALIRRAAESKESLAAFLRTLKGVGS
ncbi:MAG: tryptophan synthase subunit alpha [Candidatus Hydrogenedentota bacterium]|nr:MAG: tryptophan synthase subunit alpha [Candidatus Hydrogenedentota bacterium]